MKIFVTGATGFIGSHLCHRLIADGHQVVALVRNPEKAKCLPDAVETISGDLSLFKQDDLVLPECDLVIHMAGVLFARDAQAYHETNCRAVQDLLQCLNRQTWRPKRFVFASSLAAVGPSDPERPAVEDDPAKPIEDYGRSKLAAEQALRDAPFPVTVFRPGMVLGPRDLAMLTVFKMAARGIGFKVAGLNQKFSFIFVEDLVSAIMKMALDTRPNHQLYFTGYKTHADMETFWKITSDVLQRKIRVLKIPKPVLFGLMIGSSLVTRFFPVTNKLNYKQYRQMTVPAFLCSSEALQRDLNWEPQHDLRTSIAKTAAGYKAAGWI